jgi:hypothetical protein
VKRAATAQQLFEHRVPGEPTAKEFADIAFASEEEIHRLAAGALRDGAPDWKRRLIAWRLEGNHPPRRGRGRPVDLSLAREVLRLQASGMKWEEILEELDAERTDAKALQGACQRSVQATVKRAKRAAARNLIESTSYLVRASEAAGIPT